MFIIERGYNGRYRVKDGGMISPDWVGEIEGGFQQSTSWVRLFEIARKLEVRNLKIDVHYGAVIIRVCNEYSNIRIFELKVKFENSN